jgi:hypothetical protein
VYAIRPGTAAAIIPARTIRSGNHLGSRPLGAVPMDEWTVYRLTDTALQKFGHHGATTKGWGFSLPLL